MHVKCLVACVLEKTHASCEYGGGLQADPQSFDRIREVLARKYQNANMKPDRHASYLRLRALKHLWHVDNILLELKLLTPAAVQACSVTQ